MPPTTSALDQARLALNARYRSAGWEVGHNTIDPATFGWIYTAELHQNGRLAATVTTVGKRLEITGETLIPTAEDPFTREITALPYDRLAPSSGHPPARLLQ
jgi:hypothetical protein